MDPKQCRYPRQAGNSSEMKVMRDGEPGENAEVTKTLKGGEDTLITQRDVCDRQCRDTKKAHPKQESQDGGEGWQRDHRVHIEMPTGREAGK